MVDTSPMSTTPNGDRRLSIPTSITMTSAEVQRIPSPGTQRALKAQTGRTYDELVGPDADGADRFQTFIWTKLRRDIPELRWDECADTDIEIEDGAAVDPTKLVASAPSPVSAGSGD